MKAAHGLRKDNKGMSRQDAKQAIRKNGTFQANSVAALKQSTTAAKGALKSTPRAIGAALVGSTSVGQAIQKGYRDTASGIDKEKNKAKQEDASKEEAEFRQHQISVTDQINASTTVIADQGKRANIKLDDLIDNTDQTLTQTINIDRKLGKVSGNVDTIAKNTETTAQQTVNIDRKLGTVSGNVEAIAKNTETTAQQTVNIDRKLGKVSGDVDTIATNTKNTVQRTVDIDQKNDSLL